MNGLQSLVAASRAQLARRMSPAKNPYKTLPMGWMEPDASYAFAIPAQEGAGAARRAAPRPKSSWS